MAEHPSDGFPTDGSPPIEGQSRVAKVVLGAMSDHRSVRAFEAVPVEDTTIERAVTAAQCAATSSWIQGYHLIQVTDPTERARLAELSGGQAQVAEAGAFFVVCGDTRRHQLVALDHGQSYAPCTETFLLSVVDGSLFAQNLTLAFESEGLGTCYIGGLRNDIAGVDKLLALPHGVFPLFGLCVGHPKGGPEGRPDKRPRMDPTAVWSKGRYPADDEVRASIAAHDAVAAEYYGRRGAPGRNWSGGVWRKFVQTLRPDLKAYYESKGASFT